MGLQVFMKTSSRNIQFIYDVKTILDPMMIDSIDHFVAQRGGYHRPDLKSFGVNKRWTPEQAQKVFDALGVDIQIIQAKEKTEKPLHKQLVMQGKYRGFPWEDVPIEYLTYVLKQRKDDSLFGEMVYSEHKRRSYEVIVESRIVDFGKYKGLKWRDLPLDYLYWLQKNVDVKSERRGMVDAMIAIHVDKKR